MSKDMKGALENALKSKVIKNEKGPIPVVSLGVSPLAGFGNEEELDKLKTWIADRVGEIKDRIGEITNCLKMEWSKLQTIFDMVKAAEQKVICFINDDNLTDNIRHELARGAFGAALELYPRTPIGMQFLSQLGVETGYLRSVGKGVSLPIRTKEGKVEWEQMLPPHGHDVETSALIDFAKEVQANRNARHDERVATLRNEGSMRFTDALEKGGKSLVRITQQFGLRVIPLGAVLVEVKDNVISFLNGDGYVSKHVKNLMSAKITIPVGQVQRNEFYSPAKLEQDVLYSANEMCRGLHTAMLRGQEAAKFQASLDEFKSKATVTLREFLSGSVGVAHMYLKYWKRRNPFTLFEDVNILIERNKKGLVRVTEIFGDRPELTDSETGLLKDCVSFQETGDNFAELPYPLNAMLSRMETKLSRPTLVATDDNAEEEKEASA